MIARPRIVILEDERPQLLAVRSALYGIGEIKEFADPDPALAYLKTNVVDAAIVDIHMPRYGTNGLEFLRNVRTFDKDLSVIIRTGDASSDLADGAIEVGAFRRAIKGKISVDELRDLTIAAVNETRTRRQLSSDAASTSVVKNQWAQTLGSVEDTLSIADCYRGLLQGMRNHLTAMAGVAEVLNEASERDQPTIVREYAVKNRALVVGLIADVNAFLDGPFAETVHASPSGGHVSANSILELLRRHFAASPKWATDQKTVNISGLGQDLFVSAVPVRLLTALRHLVEFCLHRSAPKSAIHVTARCVEHVSAEIEAVCEQKIVFTEPKQSHPGICVAFRVSGQLIGTSLEDIRRLFREYSERPDTGNLQMIPLALAETLAAATVHVTAREISVFDLYLPISR